MTPPTEVTLCGCRQRDNRPTTILVTGPATLECRLCGWKVVVE